LRAKRLAAQMALCYDFLATRSLSGYRYPCCVRVSRESFELTLIKWEPAFSCGAEASSGGPVKQLRGHPPLGGTVQNDGPRHGGAYFLALKLL